MAVRNHPIGVAADQRRKLVYVANGESGNISTILLNEILHNQSLDAIRNNLPRKWTPYGLEGTDHLDAAERYDGRYSLLIRGNPLIKKRLTQIVKEGGMAGDRLGLSAVSKAEGVTAASAYRVFVRLSLTGGGTRTVNLNFSLGTHDWERSSTHFHAPADFDGAFVTVEFQGVGKAWFDEIHYWHDMP